MGIALKMVARYTLIILSSVSLLSANLLLDKDLEKVMRAIVHEENANLISYLDNEIEDRVTKLEEISKIGTLRTCAEYGQYGLKSSGLYVVDPDGGLIGQEPFQVYCNFSTGATELMHNTEKMFEVEHCHDPGCYQKDISYYDGQTEESINIGQIESLIELSEYCEQTIHYDCTLAPFHDSGVDYVFWEDRHGGKNTYFTGSNSGYHVCDCHYHADGCHEEHTMHNRCNCDARIPAPESDSGTITNSTALPIMKLYFGGLNYGIQYAAFLLGRLKCYGQKQVEIGTSCSALKKKGNFQSGYYNVKQIGDLRPSLVFCDMTSDGYEDVPQIDEIGDDFSPIGTILAWVPKPQDSFASLELPDGWMRCDGTHITKGPWKGGKTPDLNSVGAFLRGGKDDHALEMEDDQVEDHSHNDQGHHHSCSASSNSGSHHHSCSASSHSSSHHHTCSASSHSSSHHHSYSYARTASDDGEICGTSGNHCSDPDTLEHVTTNTGSSYVGVSTTCSTGSSNVGVSTTCGTGSSYVGVSTTCSTGSVHSGITGVASSAKSGLETRPLNMKVIYVIRIY